MTALHPDTPATLAALEAHGEVASHADEELPRSAWTVRDGHVFVPGIGFVQGGYGVPRVRYVAQIDGFTCQAPGCYKLYARPEVALWRRYENALGRRMYWLALAADAPRRSSCYACEPAEATP